MEYGSFIENIIKSTKDKIESRVKNSSYPLPTPPPKCKSPCPEGKIMNEDFYRYVGWKESEQEFDKLFFSMDTLNKISDRLKDLLKCLRKDGRPIVVSDKVISHMMSEVFRKNRPQLGDMYTMFIIPPETLRNDLETMSDMVVEMIFNTVKTEYEMEQNNKGLTIWTSVLGDFNKHGLRQYTSIKINEKNINKVRFNMNY